jgi:hypothetical protein
MKVRVICLSRAVDLSEFERQGIIPQIGWHIIEGGTEYVVRDVTVDMMFGWTRVFVDVLYEIDSLYATMARQKKAEEKHRKSLGNRFRSAWKAFIFS